MQLDTVNLTLLDGAATIELNRPQALNAWNKQLGEDLLAALEPSSHRARRPRRSHHRRRAGLLLRRRPARHQRRRLDARGPPERLRSAHRALPPDHARHSRDGKAGGGGGQRRRGRHRLLAGALLRSGAGGAERLLPARLRQHRTGARRGLLAVRARPAWGWRGPPRWRCSASAYPRRRRSIGDS